MVFFLFLSLENYAIFYRNGGKDYWDVLTKDYFVLDKNNLAFYSVGFSSDEEGKLSFTLQPYAKYESYFQDESLSGTFEDVGTASYSPLEAYIEQNPFDSKNTLSEERATPLNADMGKAITDVEVVYDDGIKEKDSTTERNYSSDRTTTIYQTNTTRTRRDYYRAKASDVEEGLEEGGVYELRLEADNTIEKDPIEGISYEEVGGKPSLYLEDILSGSTRDGDYYFYHGYQADDFLTFLTGYHFLDTEELRLKVGENGIESLQASFGYGNEAYDENLQLVPYHYEATITSAAHEAIPDLAPFPEDEESQKVETILADTVSGTYSYTAYDTAMKNDEGTYMRKETIVSESDVLVLDYGFTGDLEEIKGYQKNDENSLIPYEVTYENGKYTAKALSSPVPGKLSDYLTPISVSPSVLTFLSDDVLVPKEGVKGFYGRIPTYENGKYIVDDSLRIEVDDENRIANLRYAFNMYNYFTGEEGVDFQYGEFVYPTGLKETIAAMPEFEAPSSWQDYSEEVWTEMVNVLGEDIAIRIPFLYVYKEEKPYVLSTEKDCVYLFFLGDKSDSTFVDTYRAYLEGLSDFTKTTSKDETVFTGNGLRIEIASTDYDGIHFRVDD